jgi:hypothetical protein
VSRSTSTTSTHIPAFSCLVLVRDPVERTISYYYQRISRSVPLSSLAPASLRATLMGFKKDGSRRFKGNWDEGPVEPTVKSLCGHWNASGSQWETPGCGAPVAAGRLGRCFVGVLDAWPQSCAVLRRQLPWLSLNCSARVNDHRASPAALKAAASAASAGMAGRGGAHGRSGGGDSAHRRRRGQDKAVGDGAANTTMLSLAASSGGGGGAGKTSPPPLRTGGGGAQPLELLPHETRETLPPALVQVIVDLNPGEALLHTAALRLVASDARRLGLE